MARVLFMCVFAAIVDLMMVCAFIYCLCWGKGAPQAGIVFVLACVLHALLTPAPEDRNALHEFLKIQR